MSSEIVSDGSVPSGIFGGIGVALATFAAIIYKKWKRPVMSIEAHHKQTLIWVEEIKEKIDKSNELLSALSTPLTRLVEIAERQEATTIKIWEQMLRRDSRE